MKANQPGHQRVGRDSHTPAKSRAKVHDLLFDMEVPLNEAIDHVVALRLIGCGLTTLDKENGRSIVTTSWAASQQLIQ